MQSNKFQNQNKLDFEVHSRGSYFSKQNLKNIFSSLFKIIVFLEKGYIRKVFFFKKKIIKLPFYINC